MPAKNIIKEYVDGGVYHVYNRGSNKQDIFLDERDYATFLLYLKLYLDNPEILKDLDVDPQKRKAVDRQNFYGKINLLCYCLMPNHFHLLIKQLSEKDLTELIRCIATNYSMYFNKRYDRRGPLYEGNYKAVLVKTDNYLLHLSRYIHSNPFAKGPTLGKLSNYSYSSYPNYLGKKNTNWLNTDFILNYFEENRNQEITLSKFSSYKEFIEDRDTSVDSREILGDLIIE